MPVVKQVTYYSFNELSEQAQQRVIDKVREWDDLFLLDEECIIQAFVERHPHIHNMDIYYTGFNSQGDGASFTGYIDGDWAINNLLIEQVNKAFGSLLRDLNCTFDRGDSTYCHENTVRTHLEDATWADHIEENDTLRDFLLEQHYDDIVNVIEQYRLDLCHTLYWELEQGYEHCYSDENIKEQLLANDYLFDIDGNFE